MFRLSSSLNKDRVFILQKSELEKRLDPFYYIPKLVELEKKVLTKQPKKLRDYVKGISSGATPKTTESELYYTEKENGIPFLRVQNLSPTGVLEFDDCKYINEETHKGMLKRSQVSAGDLLVKITGVGRMAVASVVPEGFEGNTNQHICVIKTGSKELSETLAAFLNCDIGEKLASRRSTGGTRPALDYPALLSMPIIYDQRVLQISKKVIEQKTQNDAAAEKLLNSIDDYLLKELGITLSTPPENTLKNRIFRTTIKEISGSRFDAFYYKITFQNLKTAIESGKWKTSFLSSLTHIIINGVDVRDFVNEGRKYLRVSSIKPNWIDTEDVKFIPHEIITKDVLLQNGDLLITRKGTYGVCAPVISEIHDCVISSEIFRLSIKQEVADAWYLSYFLNSFVGRTLFDRIKTGAIMGHITQDVLGKIAIPLPPINKQKEIAKHITGIRKQAQALKDKTKEALKKASEEIEGILLV